MIFLKIERMNLKNRKKIYENVRFKKILCSNLENYICKIATLEEMEQNWNYLIEIPPNNNVWKI